MMEFQTTLHKQLRVIIITLEILILKMRVIKIIIVIIKLLIRRGWGRDVARSMKKKMERYYCPEYGFSV